MNLAGVKGIIFDLGYTLIEYKNCNWPDINLQGKQTAYNILKDHSDKLPVFEQFDLQYEDKKEKYRSRAFDSMAGWKISHVLEELLSEFEIDNAEQLGRLFLESLYSFERQQMLIYDGTIDTLKNIKEWDYKTGIISNTNYPGYLHDIDIKLFNLEPFFDFKIYSSEFGFRKPHPAIFRAGVEAIGLSAEETVYVGDRFRMDIRGATDAGMKAVLKICDKREYPDPLPIEVPVIHTIPEILGILG